MPLELLVLIDYKALFFFLVLFMTVWVEHGDEISLEYSGTHALKRDLVR